MRNRFMKRLSVIALAMLFFWGTLGGINAQVLHDPNDPLYRDIDRWAAQGRFTSTLPFVRPYPAQLLETLLEEVISRGNGADQAKAAAYKKAIATPERFIHAGARGSIEGQNGEKAMEVALFADGIIRPLPLLGMSYSYFLYGATKEPGDEYTVPGSYSPYPDMVSDQANIGPFNFMHNWTSAIAVGTGDIYFQAGLNRTSFGPFYENSVVIGPQAARAGHFGVNFRQPKWSFEILLLALTASDNLGQGMYPNKYMFLHSLNFRPIPSLELSFVESVIWGERLDLLYLIPFNNLFASQSMGDFGDNSIMGFNVRWAAFQDTLLLLQVYVDDFHVNDMIRLKLNTKYKLAAEAGFTWSPQKSPLLSLSADYSLVFPYMYTHITSPYEDRYGFKDDGSDAGPAAVNYVNYAHMGRNLGPDLQPNSDRISLRTRWQALPGLEVSGSAYLTRHGNPSAGVDDMDYGRHDGSIFDDGNRDKDPYDNNYRYLHFLTQDVIDTRLGAGIGLGWTLPVSFGEFTFSAGYVLEYGWNRGFDTSDDSFVHYWSLGGGFRW
ncbi:hypothetical protein AGMMS49928_17560 [Spirochaetia bacterium]|nr:hypothetical protein AGMMS49928_17560 [Spirochaetia bacterium]